MIRFILIFLLSSKVVFADCTVVIDGITYSGSQQTAYDAYLETEQLLKKILYDESLNIRDKKIDHYLKSLEQLGKFRCACKSGSKGILRESPTPKDAQSMP